jgi:AraC-like DNA-binding protein/mannose-6-phosphate isomerase-like protein (cupin superfamily)
LSTSEPIEVPPPTLGSIGSKRGRTRVGRKTAPAQVEKQIIAGAHGIPTSQLSWSSEKTLVFAGDGRHIVQFQEGFPFLWEAYRFSRDVHLTPSYHDYLEIVYIHEGSCIFHVGDREYACKAGDVVIIGDTEFHYLETNPKEVLKDINLFFMPEFVYEAGSDESTLDYLIPFFGHSNGFSHRIPAELVRHSGIPDRLAAIRQELDGRKEYYQLAVKNYLREILLWILRYYSHGPSTLEAYNTKKRNIRRLGPLFDFVQAHYQNSITLQRAAQTACMSGPYFCRFFKKVTGHTFTDYLSRVRVDKAKELLLRSDLPITVVGLEVGFESHSYFDRVFKRLTGKSPHEYRNSP